MVGYCFYLWMYLANFKAYIIYLFVVISNSNGGTYWSDELRTHNISAVSVLVLVRLCARVVLEPLLCS